MIYSKGDLVKTNTGETGTIIDTWGVARDWCKIKTNEGKFILIMTIEIESIISRAQDQKKKTIWGIEVR